MKILLSILIVGSFLNPTINKSYSDFVQGIVLKEKLFCVEETGKMEPGAWTIRRSFTKKTCMS